MKIWTSILFVAFALLVLVGCTPKRELAGNWHAYCPFVQASGGSMTFDNSTFKLTGRVNNNEPTSITITGTYNAGPGLLHLTISNVDFIGIEKLDKISRDLATSDKNNLLEIKNMDLSVTWASDYVAVLKSTAKGPGPLGETNFILERNAGQASKIFGAVGTAFSYVSKSDSKKTDSQPGVVYSVPKKPAIQDLPAPSQSDSEAPPPADNYSQQPGPTPPDESNPEAAGSGSQDDNQSQQEPPPAPDPGQPGPAEDQGDNSQDSSGGQQAPPPPG